MPSGVFTNFSFAPTKGAINVLLLDVLNTPVGDQVYARTQIKQYIQNANPTNRIAIFGLTGSRLVILQGFTTDPAVLKAAIDNKKAAKASPLLADDIGNGTQGRTVSQVFEEATFGADAASTLAALRQFDATQQAFDQQLRVKYTLDALNQLARSLAGIPGRKNLLWFSGAFPIRINPDFDPAIPGGSRSVLPDPFAVVADSESEFHETIGLLARAQVAVYPIDVRGVISSTTNTATNPNHLYAIEGPNVAIHDENQFQEKIVDEHSTMQQLADGTGGRAFINTNDLTHAVAKSVEEGANYYTITYSPSDTNWNGGFRKVQVDLQQTGLTLAYRRGYYADNPNSPASKDDTPAVAAAKAVHLLDPMQAAMIHGGPLPTQIAMKVRVLPASLASDSNLAPNNVLNPKLKFDGPYRRYAIDYAASPREIVFTKSPDGRYQTDIEFQTYVYDQDGSLFNVIEDRKHGNLPPDAYADTMHHGVLWHQEVSVPLKGDFYLRIGVRDLTSNRVASVEVPVAAVKNLPPQTTPASSPSTSPATTPAAVPSASK